MTKDLPPMAFEALALGSLLWAGRLCLKAASRHPYRWTASVLLLLAVLEWVRVAVVGFDGDTTPLVVAGLLGVFVASFSLRAQAPGLAAPAPATMPAQPVPTAAPAKPASYKNHLAVVAVLALLLGVGANLPGVPYNVRELLAPGMAGALSVLGLALAIYSVAQGGFVLCLPRWRKWFLALPASLALHGLWVYWLLSRSVPPESLFDIVGSPVLGWPWECELLGRYVALHMSLMLQVVGAVLCVRAILKPDTLADFIYWAVASLLLAWPLYQVVVAWAATDNLTELMANSASFGAASALAGAFFMTCLAASAASAAMAVGRRVVALWLLAGLAAAAAALLYWLGAEPAVVKYGRVFSAFQFLLSTDRTAYVQGLDLALRYAVAFVVVSGGLAAAQWVGWRGMWCATTGGRRLTSTV